MKASLPKSNLEIPLANKGLGYLMLEKLPGALSWLMLLLAFILSATNALAGAIYVLVFIIVIFIKGLVSFYNSWRGYTMMAKCEVIDWHQRLTDLEEGFAYHQDESEYGHSKHLQNIRYYQDSENNTPKVKDIYHVVIIAVYNETRQVLDPTIKSLLDTTYDKQRMIVCIAYEQRGGAEVQQMVHELLKDYRGYFFDMMAVEHPSDMPNEVIGKGGNISFAAKRVSALVRQHRIDPANVIVTTLDSDNRPHQSYFDYVTYEFVLHPNRQQVAYQPIALFLNNIWDAPAPIRVVATSNSFWNVVCTSRVHKLRNFASHSQPLLALEGMNYWSRRTIVEDGHQFWRSYFYFKGKYKVVPVRVPVYQDAVLSSSYRKTLKDQFIQVRRWAYGASDIPYVGTMIWRYRRELPLGDALWKFLDLLEGHITWATTALLVLIGGWLPLLFNQIADRSLVAYRLPLVIGAIQQIAMIGMVATVVFYIKTLPPRPKRYKPSRGVWMALQWFLIPVSSIIYGSLASFYSQTRLLIGWYLDKFDATDKNTVLHD